MRAILDFHGFFGGSTTVRQLLSRRWSSSEMLQGVGREGLHMRVISFCSMAWGVEECGEYLLRVVVLNRWVSKVHLCSNAPLHLGSSPLCCLLIHSTERFSILVVKKLVGVTSPIPVVKESSLQLLIRVRPLPDLFADLLIPRWLLLEWLKQYNEAEVLVHSDEVAVL
ncbi:hypothetical protein Bca101_059867 [Brassica carinata]